MKYGALLSMLVLLLLAGCKKEGDTVVYQESRPPVANHDTASTFVGNPIAGPLTRQGAASASARTQ